MNVKVCEIEAIFLLNWPNRQNIFRGPGFASYDSPIRTGSALERCPYVSDTDLKTDSFLADDPSRNQRKCLS